VIDNFAPQPYPLECSVDGETWSLVIGWRKDPTGQFIEPLVAMPDGGIMTVADPDELRYRPAVTRPSVAPGVERVATPAAAPRRERAT
jgi:hypothetical protein